MQQFDRGEAKRCLTWNPNWQKVTHRTDLSVFTTSERSLFHDVDRDTVAAVLQDLGAEISNITPSSSKIRRTIGKYLVSQGLRPLVYPEGYLVAEQGDQQDYIYAAQRGSLVVFQDLSAVKRLLTAKDLLSIGRSKSSLPIDEYRPSFQGNKDSPNCALPLLTLNHLYHRCKCHSVLWPTQAMGLIELDLAGRHSPYKGLDGKWLYSTMASEGSRIVRIPVESLYKYVKSDTRTISHPEYPTPLTLAAYFRIRVHEILALRFSQLSRNLYLANALKYDKLLAHLLYEYSAGTRKPRFQATAFRIAFYLNDTVDNVRNAMTPLINYREGYHVALRQPTQAKNDDRYLLTGSLCLKYYRQEFGSGVSHAKASSRKSTAAHGATAIK